MRHVLRSEKVVLPLHTAWLACYAISSSIHFIFLVPPASQCDFIPATPVSEHRRCWLISECEKALSCVGDTYNGEPATTGCLESSRFCYCLDTTQHCFEDGCSSMKHVSKSRKETIALCSASSAQMYLIAFTNCSLCLALARAAMKS